MRKCEKGEYGYISAKRKNNIFKTLIMFGIILMIFIVGYIYNGTKNNVLTVVAVCGCLPACRSAVGAIMLFVAKGCSPSCKNEIENAVGSLDGYYDLFFTSEVKNYAISHLVVTESDIIALTENDKLQEEDFYKHIKKLLENEGISGVTVTLFKNCHQYCEELRKLNREERDKTKRDDVVNMMFQVTL